MATARERAREAALEADKRQDGLFVGSDRRDLFADAASDVWEKLLRDLMEECVSMQPFSPILSPAWNRAKEALA